MVLKVMKMPVASRVVFKVHKHNQGRRLYTLLYTYITFIHNVLLECHVLLPPWQNVTLNT